MMGRLGYHVVRPGWFPLHVAVLQGRLVGWGRLSDAQAVLLADGYPEAYVEKCGCG